MRNRIVALLITFFGGAFGLHKFYLGENFAGILYFLFSWTGIPIVLTFFEFLGLLFMTDNDFNRKFNGARQAEPLQQPSQNSALPSRSTHEIATTILELKKLYENDIITAEEYESKRRKLLDSI